MRLLSIIILISISPIQLIAQYQLRVQVDDFTGKQPVYLSGTVNQWNPADERYKLKKINYYRSEIVLKSVKDGKHEFRLTRGSLEKVEVTKTGTIVPNRRVDLSSDTTIVFNVQGWSDQVNDPRKFSDSARLMEAVGKGFTFLNTDLDSSFKYALQTFPLSSKIKDPLLKCYALNLQGELLLKLGNSQKALELLEEGLRIRRFEISPPDSGSISFLLNQIGDVYWQLRDTIHAVWNYKESMLWTAPYVYDHPLHEGICNRLCNIGRVYLNRNKLDSAKWYAAKSGSVADRISAITDLFRGEIAEKESDNQEALKYFRSAMTLGMYHDNNIYVTLMAHEGQSRIFEKMHLQDSAIVHYRKAFQLANTLGNDAAVNRIGLLLANMLRSANQFDSAFHYQELLIRSAHEQFNHEQERLALNTYFSEKIREEKAEAQKKDRLTKLWTFGLTAMVLSLILLMVHRYRRRLQSGFDKKMKEVEMRALRAQMNPHFIFNCLASINRYIVKSDTRTASNYLTKFAKLIRLILDNSSNDHISLYSEIQTLQLYLDMESLRFDHGFDYEIQKDDNLQEDLIQLPSMLIQPYVENAIWHGLLQKEEKGKLWVRFRKVNGHLLQAEIEDNGIGRQRASELKSKNAVKHKSYGMQISSDRIKIINNLYKLKNSVSIEDLVDQNGNASGTKITLNIPVS